MCSEYSTKTTPKAIEAALGVPLIDHTSPTDWGKSVRLTATAPVIRRIGEKYELGPRVFPVSPFPNSRLSNLEGQTDAGNEEPTIEDTQIKRIYDLKTWKAGFADEPLLVPMDEFTEFAYWGPEIGTAQGFKVANQEVLFAAGIGIRPYTPKGQAGGGFSIITHTATDQMLEYHHRLIVLLPQEKALDYLGDLSSEERFNYLIENRYTGELSVRKLRNISKNWESKISKQEEKLQTELRYRKILDANQVLG